MGIDYKPQNMFEKAIRDHNTDLLLQSITQGERVHRLVALSCLGSECFTDALIFAVLYSAVSQKQLETMRSWWFWGYLHAGGRLRNLVEEALTALPQDPDEQEKKLVKAIVYRDNKEIIRLIQDEKVRFRGFAPELLLMLPELSKPAVLVFLRDGLSARLKGIVFRILLEECSKPDLLKSFSYEEHIKYINLMMRILAEKNISADEVWYPEQA